MLPSVEYLGHQINHEGIRPLEDKVEAIAKAPTPSNLRELWSFLGLLNYYGKFIPNLATIIHPLTTLLSTGKKSDWSVECVKAFQLAKSQLMSAQVLTHYDPQLPITLAADASAYGIGAVISHILPDGSERPIAFASRKLSPTEQNYAQVEREALSLIFGIKKFHQYLYGRKFCLVTDHKPLTSIFGPIKDIPSLAAARLQRWALLLSAYDYDIKYKSTDAHANADCLSRLPLQSTSDQQLNEKAPISVFNVSQISALPVTCQDIQRATRTDRLLSQIYNYVKNGWPRNVNEELKPYFLKKKK